MWRTEAIFLGVYLYGWRRLTPRMHLLSGGLVAFSGALSAFFVVTANSWMNSPTGFAVAGGNLVIPLAVSIALYILLAAIVGILPAAQLQRSGGFRNVG